MPLQAHIRRAAASIPRAQRTIRASVNRLTVREGETGTFDVWLSERPRTGQTVTVAVSSNAPGEASVSPASLEFSDTSFATRQPVTVTGVADPDARDENASVSLVATGGGYDDSTAIAVVVEDTTQKRLRVSDASLAFSSTTLSRTIGVRLSSQPVGGNVTVAVSDNSGRFGTDVSSLTFTSANWNVQQFVRVTATAGGNATGTLTLDPSGADYGSVASVTVPLAFTLTLPAVPTGLSLSASYYNNNTQQRVRATWNAAARATTYEVRYKKSTETNWTTVTGLSSTSYTANGADPNSTYDVQVQSRNASGPSGWSSTVQVTTGRSRGNLYLVGERTRKIYRMAGGFGNSWDAGIDIENKTGIGQQAGGIAFDSAGNLYATDYTGSDVNRMLGGYGNSWDSTVVDAPNTNESLGQSMAFDSDGNMYVLWTTRIYRMAGGFGNSWDAGIAIATPAAPPGGIAFDPMGNLYLGISGRIYRMAGGYSTTGTWDSSSVRGPNPTQTGTRSTITLTSIAFDSAGNLYAAVFSHNPSVHSRTRIHRMSGGWSTSRTWDAGITVPSGETDPRGIAFD